MTQNDSSENLIDLDEPEVRKKSKSLILLAIGVGLILLIHVAAFTIVNRETSIWLAFSMIIAFAVNVAGLTMGLEELSSLKKKSIFGVVGNSICILYFLTISLYSVSLAL